MSKKDYKGDIAAAAWDATKADSDVDFDNIPNPEFKNDLNFRAAKVKETGTAITNFEQEVLRLHQAEKKNAVNDGPMAVVADGVTDDDSANATALTDEQKKAAAQREKAADKKKTDAKTEEKKAASELKPSTAKTAAEKLDNSGHVPTGKEAASIVKEEAQAPKHP